jgi:uroporphyrinogen decarboxylase
MQNSHDVIDGLLRGPGAERVGLCDGPWADTLRKWVGQGYPSDAEGRPADPVDVFGYDVAGVGGWFDPMPHRGFSEVLQETDEWRVTRNGAGAALKYWKNKSGTPEHIDFLMTSRKVWERDYRPHLLEPDPERVNIDQSRQALRKRREQGLWTEYGHLFIWENARQSMGDICLYESMLLDPGWMHDYNRVYTDFWKAHYRILFEAGAAGCERAVEGSAGACDAAAVPAFCEASAARTLPAAPAGLPDGVHVYEDLGYRNGLFCSPRVLADIVFPYYAELVDFFHSYDLPVLLHSCGRVEEALELIVDAGFDCLDPMEIKAGNRPLEYAERYGDRLAFMGGLDARVLESGDRALIRREVAGLIEGMKSRGARYIFHSDHSLSTNVDYDDYRYALDVYREHMTY